MFKTYLQKYWTELSALSIFIIYCTTPAPGVVEIDSGELAAVQITFGIAHPTGYPLFTLIGYIFSLIPLPFTKIFQANLLAAIYCTAAFYFICKTLYKLAGVFLRNSIKEQKNKKDTKKKKIPRQPAFLLSEPGKILVSLLSGLTLAFSTTFWLQSTSVEVYSLHLLVVSLILYYFAKLFEDNNNTPANTWLILSGLFALGFSNHMSTLMLVPSALLIFALQLKRGQLNVNIIPKSGLLFIFILTACYSILFVRAGFDPTINWGNPESFENLIRHITGKQYQVWLFSSLRAAKENAVNFFNSLPNELGIPLLIIGLIGGYFSFRRSKQIFTFLIINFLFTVAYASNYDIKDLQTYYLLAIISVVFFISAGIITLVEFCSRYKNGTKIYLSVIVIIVLFEAGTNYSKVNQSDVYIFEDYTKALIGSTDENSIVFSYQWDYFLSASYYFQFAENYRKDVTVVDKELLRRSWYYDQLRNIKPDLFSGFENDVSEFLKALRPFEQNENFDAGKLETYFQRIMTNLVKFNSDGSSFYIGPELVENELRNGQFKLPEGYSIVPDLFLFKATKTNNYVPASDPDFIIRIPEAPNQYHKFIENLCAKMLIYRILYELEYNKTERARLYANKVLSDFPGIPLPENIKKKLSL